MALEQFIENDTYRIAAAYELTKWSILKAYNLHYNEKEQKYEDFLKHLTSLVKKYEDFLKELAALVKKYKVSDAELFDAQVSLEAESLEDEEMLERADKLIALDASWYA